MPKKAQKVVVVNRAIHQKAQKVVVVNRAINKKVQKVAIENRDTSIYQKGAESP